MTLSVCSQSNGRWGGGTFHIWGTMSTALPPTQARMLGALQFNTHSLVAPFGYQG